MSTIQNAYSIGAGRALRTYATVLADREAAAQ